MSEDKGFFVSLSSTADLTDPYYDIKEKLQYPIDTTFGEALEVSVKRATYPQNWYETTSSYETKFSIVVPYLAVESGDEMWRLKRYEHIVEIFISPPENQMDTDWNLASYINTAANKQLKDSLDAHQKQVELDKTHFIDHRLRESFRFNLSLNENSMKYEIKDPAYFSRVFPEDAEVTKIQGYRLWHRLGFTQFRFSSRLKLPIIADNYPSAGVSSNLIMIKAPNLIGPQLVGSGLDPVLDIIPVLRSDRQELITYYQRRPIYKRVLRTYINEIVIDIRDQDNRKIPHFIGKINILLHFRKCSRQ